jgi:hypothetical protein
MNVIKLIFDEQVGLGNVRYLWVNLKPCLFVLFFAFKDDSRGNIPSIGSNTFHSGDKLEIGTTKFIFWALGAGNKEFLSQSPAATSTLDALLIHVVDILRGDVVLCNDCLKKVEVAHDCRTIESLGPFGVQT